MARPEGHLSRQEATYCLGVNETYFASAAYLEYGPPFIKDEDGHCWYPLEEFVEWVDKHWGKKRGKYYGQEDKEP